MKMPAPACRTTRVSPSEARHRVASGRSHETSDTRGFTLLEIMLVVGILGIVLGMGIPTFYHAIRGGAMSQALGGVMDACAAARAQAILQSKPVSVIFHPLEGSYAVEGGGGNANQIRPGAKLSGRIDDSISIEMLDINLMEFRDADTAKVRFFPNGTTDEFTLILHSDQNEWRKLTLESTTGLVTVGDVK